MTQGEELPFTESAGEESIEVADKCCGCDVKYCLKQENTKRSNWLLNGHSTLALIGLTFQPGVIYRFPYQFYRYGPVYLVLYVLGIAVVGFPLMHLELTLGQFSSSGVLTCWPLPIFKGVGAGMISYGLPMAIVQSTIGAWSMYYLFETMRSSSRSKPLPWTSRHNVLSDAPECQDNLHWVREPRGPWTKLPASVYFECHVLKQPLEAGTEPTSISTGTTVCSLVLWVLVTLSAIFGVKSIGPVVNVTVPLAVIILLIMTVRALTLDGSIHGMPYLFMYSNWYELSDWNIWFEVLREVIYSLSCGCGLVLTFGSYNRFHNGYVRDAAITCVSAILIRILGAVIVMGFVGFQSYQRDLAVNDIVRSGLDLEFVILPDIIKALPVASVWCGLLFTMMLLTTFHSMIGYVEMIVSAVLDQLPRLRRLRFAVVIVLGFVGFMLTLPMCTSEGRHLLTLLDVNIVVCQPFLIIILMITCYIIYGVMTYFAYRHDVAAMIGWDCCCSPSIVCWMYTTCGGLALTIVLMVFLIAHNVSTMQSVRDIMDNLPDWMTAGFEKTIQVYVAIIIVIVFLLQLAVAFIWKKPPVGELFRRVWRPALRQHEKIVRRYRENNKYSSQQYGPKSEVYPASTLGDQRPQTPPPPYAPPPYPGELADTTKL